MRLCDLGDDFINHLCRLRLLCFTLFIFAGIFVILLCQKFEQLFLRFPNGLGDFAAFGFSAVIQAAQRFGKFLRDFFKLFAAAAESAGSKYRSGNRSAAVRRRICLQNFLKIGDQFFGLVLAHNVLKAADQPFGLLLAFFL